MNWDTFSKWWAQPLQANASVSSWFLFTGLILIAIFLWTRILREGEHYVSKAV